MAAPLHNKRFEAQSLSLHASKLPPASQVFGRLVAAINDGNSSLDRMAELVRLDTALTSQLLRIANSVLFGFRSQATSVEEAVLRVGLKELHRIVGLCAASLAFQSDLQVYGTTAEALWGNAVATAVAMEKLCVATGGDAALGYTAGLLRSVGKMVLARHAAGAVEPFSPDKHGALPEWEQSVFGSNHAQVGSALCELWRFPKPIASALRDHLRPAANPHAIALAHLLNFAGLLAERLGRGLPGETALWADDPLRFEKTGFDARSIDGLQAETQAEVDRMGAMLAVIRAG